MLLPIRKISHKKQTLKDNCVSTCLSIVTGLDEEYIRNDIISDGFEAPFSSESAMRFLCRNGIHMEVVNGTYQCGLLADRVYLMSCPSSVSAKMAHMIVGLTVSGSVLILDPADDLESEKVYSGSNYSNGNVPVFSYYLLTDCNKEDQ